MAHAPHWRKFHTSLGRWLSAMPRRVGLIGLMVGWSAFWLVATLQPCCRVAAAQPHAVAGSAHLHDSGHHPEIPTDPCGSITAVSHAPLASVAPAPNTNNLAQAVIVDSSLAQRPAPFVGSVQVAHPPLPPPRAVAAFHQRTSRILI